MAWYEMYNGDHAFVFFCPDDMSPYLISSIICDEHGLDISDFELSEVSLNSQFCE